MNSKSILIALSLILGLSSLQALACGDYCSLYNTTGYQGYGLGSSMSDLGSYYSSYSDPSWGGGCGSFSNSCGSSGGIIDITINIYGSSGSSCGGSCGATPYMSGYDNYTPDYGQYGMQLLGNYTGQNYQYPSQNPMGYMDPTMMGNPNPFQNPMMPGMMPTTYPGFNVPPMMNPFPQMPPMLQPPIYPPYYPTVQPPYVPPTYPIYPTPVVTVPTTNYIPTVPTIQNPLIPISTTPYTGQAPVTIPNGSPTTLPWGGCDNVIVMCPGGPLTRPGTIPVPQVTPMVGTPNISTIPQDPNRNRIPRLSH